LVSHSSQVPSTLSSRTPGSGGYKLAGGETDLCQQGYHQKAEYDQ
jgi:hypothetical protein